MSRLRDEITNTIRRLSGRAEAKSLDETVVATDVREGRQYGSYRILRRLGTGGMGHVYLALDTRLGRHAALKFLSPKLKSNLEMLARLRQEARTASSLNHPNILTIYDIDEADGEPFIASEFVEGITLRQALESGGLGPVSPIDIAVQIASALKPAHEAGVIHRDLKPSNVMLRPDGLVKVIDFGLAKFTVQGHVAPLYEPLSDPGAIAGTVQYMSPEQARGDEVDHRTDLWSLGVMLYEMVALRKPFDGETESHVIVAILDHPAAELKTGSGIPAGLTRVVEKALAKSADKRYQTADEMLNELKALESATQVKSAQFRLSRVFEKPAFAGTATKRERHGAFGAAAACAIAAGLALWWWPLGGREAMLGPAWFAPVNFIQVTHRGDVDQAALSPDGKRVAYTTIRNGENQLHLLNLQTRKEFEWPPYAGDTLGITFSPDNSSVYYTVHDQSEWGRLYQAKENSPDAVFVLDDIDGPICFSPDGSEFAFRRRFDDKRTNREAVIVAKTRDTGDQRAILTKYNQSVGYRIAWSQNGSLAINLPKRSLDGEVRPTVLVFQHEGAELGEFSDARLRLISGPVWINRDSMLLFAGFGRGGDESQAQVIELATHRGQFRFFNSPTLTPNSMTVSHDLEAAAAVRSTRKSTLWVTPRELKPQDTIEHAISWTAEPDSFDSFTWNQDDSIVHPSPRNGNVALWEFKPGVARALPGSRDCASHQPAAVPGKPLLVFASNCDASANASNLWILDETTGKLAKLTDHSHSDQKPTVAPDGDTVLYDSWPNNYPALMKISLQTRVKSQFTPFQARSAAISPDGQHVVCQVRENYDGKWRVAILSMHNGAIEKDNLPLPPDASSVIRWSPKGDALDYVDGRNATNIERFPLSGSAVSGLANASLTHIRDGAPITYFAWNANGHRLAWVSSDVQQDVIIFHKGVNQ
jgi:Tol biopolymer transport system component